MKLRRWVRDDDETLLRFTWFAFCISSERLHSSAPSFLSSRWSFSRSIEKFPTISIWKVSLTSEESSVDLNNNYSLFVSLIIAPTLFRYVLLVRIVQMFAVCIFFLLFFLQFAPSIHSTCIWHWRSRARAFVDVNKSENINSQRAKCED